MSFGWLPLGFWLARQFLRPFIHWMRYRVMPADPASALKIDPGRAVCYVLPARSWIDLLALARICAEQGLPPPVATDRSLPTPAQAACLYLPVLFEQRLQNSRITDLVERAASTPDYDVQVLPVSIFWGRNPGQETSIWRLLFTDIGQAGSIRKFLILLANGRNVFANFGRPLSFREYLNASDDSSRAQRKLARALRFHFLRARTAALGPTLLSRRTVIDTTLAAPDVQEAIAREKREKKLSDEQALHRARKILEEIAANYSSAAVTLMDRMVGSLLTRVFSGVDTSGVERLRELAQSHEMLYLPSHRSHADYLVMSYVLYHAGLVPPHVAAGVNLNFWPVGRWLRLGGAFFMRRSFAGDKLYTAIFRAYVDGLIRRGYPISFYPEGTRSRTGRLMPPKTGLMSMIVESSLRNRARRVAMVPVFIAYDKVWELNSYFKELRGGGKQRESAESLLKATRVLGRVHGKAYVSFGEPVILQDHADTHLSGWRDSLHDITAMDEKPDGFGAYVRELSRDHMRRINTAAVANPLGLVACALLAAPARAVAEDELEEQLRHLVRLLDATSTGRRVATRDGGAPLRLMAVPVPVKDPRAIIAWSAPIARLHRVPHAWGDVLAAGGRDGVLLSYTRNSIQHLFAVPSLIARLFRTRGLLAQEVIIKSCRALYPFLRNEFFLPWPTSDCGELASVWIERMVETGLLSRDPDSGYLRRPEADSSAFASLSALGRMLGETLERYAIALLLLAQEASRGGKLARGRFVEDCRLLAERMAVLTGREAPELFDRALFMSYLDSLVEVGMVQPGEGGELVLDPQLEEIAARALELLSDETRQTLAQLLARHRLSSKA